MRKLIILMGLFFVPLVTFSQSKKENGMGGILAVPYKDYVGKEVFSLLLNDTVRSYKRFIFFDMTPGILTGAMLVFNDSTYIEVFIYKSDKYAHYNTNRDWSKPVFYKEIISRVKVFENEVCILDTNAP